MDTQHASSRDQSSGIVIASGGASDKGPTRSENQDAYWIPDEKTEGDLRQLFLVADGVGGQESGADAAQLAVKTAREIYSQERKNNKSVQEALQSALQSANLAVFDESQRREVRRMGATFVAAVVQGDHLIVAHVGDARAYLVHQNEMRRLTRDDTWVQRQLEEGWITEEQAANHEYRNVVTQVLGNKPEVNVHLSKRHELKSGDAVLLCSDGLYDVLSENQMLPIITTQTAQDAAQRLIEEAIEGEASDNITAVIINVLPAREEGAMVQTGPAIADEPTLMLSEADQPTTPLAGANEPTIVPPTKPAAAPPAKEKSGPSIWLIILAISAMILIVAALLFFWMRSRDLDSAVEEAAGQNMTAVAEQVVQPTEAAGALRPAPTEEEVIVQPTQEPATEIPPATPTLLATPTLEPTPQPRGCVNDEIVGFVWQSLQVQTGNCDSTANILDPGEEVLILEETAVTGAGSCNGVQFIRVQSVAEPDLEGWIAQDAVDLASPGESCSP